MTFIEEFMIHFGVGAATLTTSLKQTTYMRGADITGTVHLQGGVSSQRIEGITVKLTEGRQSGNRMFAILDQDDVAANIHIAPDEARTYPFTLHIPDTALVTSPANWDICHIATEADILWAVNPRGNIAVNILPHAEILVLDAALRSLKFAPVDAEFITLTNNSDGMVKRTYTSPAALNEQITHAVLQVRVSNKKVLGRLILNQREVHLRDYVRAMKGEDIQEFFIELPRSSLLAEDGKTRAVAAFQEMLNQALVLPDNPQNWLLRSANRPPDGGDTLLRPAQGSAPGEADTLLRADDKPPER